VGGGGSCEHVNEPYRLLSSQEGLYSTELVGFQRHVKLGLCWTNYIHSATLISGPSISNLIEILDVIREMKNAEC